MAYPAIAAIHVRRVGMARVVAEVTILPAARRPLAASIAHPRGPACRHLRMKLAALPAAPVSASVFLRERDAPEQ